MSYASILQKLPSEFQLPLLELVESIEQNMRNQLAVRREDFDNLNAMVNGLLEAHARSEQRLDRLETVVGELAEAQQRSEQRLARLETVVGELVEAQKRTEQRVVELAEAQRRTEAALAHLTEQVNQLTQRLDRLTEQVDRLTERMDQMVTRQDKMQIRLDKAVRVLLEAQYREKPFGYFGRILRRARAVPIEDLEEELEKHLSSQEIDDLRLVDVLVRGRPQNLPDIPEAWLALEVSVTVDRNDVERAQQRATILKRAGYLAVPAVAGEETTQGGLAAARDQNVVIVQNGSILFWDEALAQALTQ